VPTIKEKCKREMEDRLRECITVLKKLTNDLGIPYNSPEVQAVKSQFDEFIRTGEPWEGVISFSPYQRDAHIRLSRKGKVELTLKITR
jgi:hypothetical protein